MLIRLAFLLVAALGLMPATSFAMDNSAGASMKASKHPVAGSVWKKKTVKKMPGAHVSAAKTPSNGKRTGRAPVAAANASYSKSAPKI